MVRNTVLALGFVALTSPLMVSAVVAQKAGPSPDQIVQTLPINIPEVISGGGWQSAGLNGIYRGVVVVTPSDAGASARVYIQWIGVKADGSAPQVVKSVPLPGLESLSNAQLSVDAERDNEATFVVTSYDAKTQKPQFVAFKAALPGDVKPAPLPPEFSKNQDTLAKKP